MHTAHGLLDSPTLSCTVLTASNWLIVHGTELGMCMQLLKHAVLPALQAHALQESSPFCGVLSHLQAQASLCKVGLMCRSAYGSLSCCSSLTACRQVFWIWSAYRHGPRLVCMGCMSAARQPDWDCSASSSSTLSPSSCAARKHCRQLHT